MRGGVMLDVEEALDDIILYVYPSSKICSIGYAWKNILIKLINDEVCHTNSKLTGHSPYLLRKGDIIHSCLSASYRN